MWLVLNNQSALFLHRTAMLSSNLFVTLAPTYHTYFNFEIPAHLLNPKNYFLFFRLFKFQYSWKYVNFDNDWIESYTFGVVSDRSTNWATITFLFSCCYGIHLLLMSHHFENKYFLLQTKRPGLQLDPRHGRRHGQRRDRHDRKHSGIPCLQSRKVLKTFEITPTSVTTFGEISPLLLNNENLIADFWRV